MRFMLLEIFSVEHRVIMLIIKYRIVHRASYPPTY